MATAYYRLLPQQIFDDIVQNQTVQEVNIKGLNLVVFPHVYPSDKFRSTNFILDNLKSYFLNASICDMGCGMGIIGLYAIKYGAKFVVQADINPRAVENAKANKERIVDATHSVQIFESDCFDAIPKQKFNVIVFNIPFHSEPHNILDPLEYAFHDPQFSSTNRFLKQARAYCDLNTKIFIAFSSKGNVEQLENLFDESGFHWKLWKVTNSNQQFDNRIYKLAI